MTGHLNWGRKWINQIHCVKIYDLKDGGKCLDGKILYTTTFPYIKLYLIGQLFRFWILTEQAKSNVASFKE